MIAWLALTATDLGTTEYCLSRPPVVVDGQTYRLVEANPLVRNRSIRVTVNVAPIVVYLMKRDDLTPKERKLVLVSAAGVKAFLTVWNVRQARLLEGVTDGKAN